MVSEMDIAREKFSKFNTEICELDRSYMWNKIILKLFQASFHALE